MEEGLGRQLGAISMRLVDAKHGPSVKAIGVDVDPPDKGAMKVGVGDCFADDVTNCLGVEGTQDVKGGLALYVMSDRDLARDDVRQRVDKVRRRGEKVVARGDGALISPISSERGGAIEADEAHLLA